MARPKPAGPSQVAGAGRQLGEYEIDGVVLSRKSDSVFQVLDKPAYIGALPCLKGPQIGLETACVS